MPGYAVGGSVSIACSSYPFSILGAELYLNNLSSFWVPPHTKEK
jgi:hypothetical protein